MDFSSKTIKNQIQLYPDGSKTKKNLLDHPSNNVYLKKQNKNLIQLNK